MIDPCVERKRKRMREYNSRPDIKERAKLYAREYRKRPDVKEKISRQKASPETRKRINERLKFRRKNDLKYRLNQNIKTAIYLALNGGKRGRSWQVLVGYTVDDLIKHLEQQFQFGMTWGNYGEWHIDHKVPISTFNFSTHDSEDFKKCWALSNLQPLWELENKRKSNKIRSRDS